MPDGDFTMGQRPDRQVFTCSDIGFLNWRDICQGFLSTLHDCNVLAPGCQGKDILARERHRWL